jgi:putative YphP/YqiW family bacilliredoxin
LTTPPQGGVNTGNTLPLVLDLETTDGLGPDDVVAFMEGNNDTTLVMVNSVCGCAAGSARPGVLKSLAGDKKPAKMVTVFAGQDVDAVAKIREYMLPYPPSSPAVALFKGGEVVHMVERHMIEGRTADMVADNLKGAFAEHC